MRQHWGQAAEPFATAAQFVKAQLEDENSGLCANAARVLEAELPDVSQASPVLHAIGSGDRTFRNIAHRCGLADQTVQRALVTLLDKHLVARDVPASVPPSEHPRYRIDDSYLRSGSRSSHPEFLRSNGGDPTLRRSASLRPGLRGGAERLSRSFATRCSGWQQLTNDCVAQPTCRVGGHETTIPKSTSSALTHGPGQRRCLSSDRSSGGRNHRSPQPIFAPSSVISARFLASPSIRRVLRWRVAALMRQVWSDTPPPTS